jgi:predicted transcriptional regulator
LGISKAKCHKAIQQLKDAGLIENAENRQEDEFIYTDTRYGSMVYEKNILEIGKYTNPPPRD